ncbi:hypothetical protein OU624_06435, partial [Escherichia coli]|nr:hypothetical protein [Escherichia coli]MDF8923566.1 hypothetical protein [Escherichia coli]
DRNRSHWSTSKTPSYTKSVSWQHHPQNRQISGGKKRRLNAFFLLATNPRKKLTVGANTLILIAFYGANNV